jgi:hypothetical protein
MQLKKNASFKMHLNRVARRGTLVGSRAQSKTLIKPVPVKIF